MSHFHLIFQLVFVSIGSACTASFCVELPSSIWLLNPWDMTTMMSDMLVKLT